MLNLILFLKTPIIKNKILKLNIKNTLMLFLIFLKKKKLFFKKLKNIIFFLKSPFIFKKSKKKIINFYLFLKITLKVNIKLKNIFFIKKKIKITPCILKLNKLIFLKKN